MLRDNIQRILSIKKLNVIQKNVIWLQNDLRKAEKSKLDIEKQLQKLTEASEVAAAETAELKAKLEKEVEDTKRLLNEEKVRIQTIV